MKNNESVSRIAHMSTSALATALFLFSATAFAQTTPASGSQGTGVTSNAPSTTGPSKPGAESAMPPAQDAQMASQEEEEFDVAPLQVGDATSNLLAWQRSGEVSSTRPRPIEGNVANRSYERYLKSFEYPIPERFSSSVKSTGGTSGTGSK
ncbi:hypothetical protein J2W30_006003 [Variovorax boronicumulans]|uniref:DUF3613 domain-containing protein n=1 Tax=Variovorax TaxID=34072 RepID=UPI002781565D|nr:MULTISPECIES: DUF3613 domain-containing protein [Variovorax]MDQ0038216.1 hypothetical protein [Variovorax boronicumulans]MDQ0606126.1 hypothetical protein [Variovorax sp. W1I1]